MTHLTRALLTIAILLGGTAAAQQDPQQDLQHTVMAVGGRGEMVRIEAGEVELLFPVEGEEAAPVAEFYIDEAPVTNRQYLEFVMANPEWQRSNVPEVFAASGYLAGWAGDQDFGATAPDAPVTGISWFAAAAYCEARGARLPTEAEWEYVARAGFEQRDGYAEAGYRERVLQLTTSRRPVPGPVRSGEANAFGVYDLHGLTWEWVFDVGSGFNTSDSRSEGPAEIRETLQRREPDREDDRRGHRSGQCVPLERVPPGGPVLDADHLDVLTVQPRYKVLARVLVRDDDYLQVGPGCAEGGHASRQLRAVGPAHR